jgi:hypothetical protein
LVARFVRDEEAVGSNPATPTELMQVRAGIPDAGAGPDVFPGPHRGVAGEWIFAGHFPATFHRSISNRSKTPTG